MNIRVKTSILEAAGYIIKVASIGAIYSALRNNNFSILIYFIALFIFGYVLHYYEKKLENSVFNRRFERYDYKLLRVFSYLFFIGFIVNIAIAEDNFKLELLLISIYLRLAASSRRHYYFKKDSFPPLTK